VIGDAFFGASWLGSKTCVEKVNATSALAADPLHALCALEAAKEGVDFVVKDLSL
jgi:hypothetical protein